MSGEKAVRPAGPGQGWAARLAVWRARRQLDRAGDAVGGRAVEWNGRSGAELASLPREIWRWRSLILELAFQKTVARYRVSLLGPVWIILGFSLFAFGIALLWGTLQNFSVRTFLPYVVVGLAIWNLLQGILGEGARCLQENRGLIHQSPAPLLIYPLVTTLKHSFLVLHTLFVVVPVLIVCDVGVTDAWWWLIPGALALLVCVCSVSVCLSIAGAYLPDLAEIIASCLRFAFFFTPIFWYPIARPGLRLIWEANPIYYAIESIRGPLLGTSDPGLVVSMLAIFALIAVIAASIAYAGWSRGARMRI